ncbi:MAG: integration host factor subunit alpha [bacterium]
MTKEEIIRAIWDQFPNITVNEARRIYETTINLLKETLVKGESIEIRGFGKFTVREKNKRMGRNPRTGEEAVIVERKVVTFKPSKIFRNMVCNNGEAIEEDDDEE